MTATQVKYRRDTEVNLNASTPVEAEIGVDLTNDSLVVGDGVTPGGIKIPNANQIQRNRFAYATTSGTADDIILTSVPARTGVTGFSEVVFEATATNTTDVTVDLDGFGAVAVKKLVDGVVSDLEAGDIVSGWVYKLIHNGTYWQLEGLASGGSGDMGDLLAIATGGGTSYDFTGLITSDYDVYEFTFENIIPATASSSGFLVQFKESGGSYLTPNVSGREEGGTYNTDTNTNALTNQSASTTRGISGEATIFGFGAVKFATLIFAMRSSATSPQVVYAEGALSYSVAVNFDGLKFYFGSGNIASGTIRMYGKKKAL